MAGKNTNNPFFCPVYQIPTFRFCILVIADRDYGDLQAISFENQITSLSGRALLRCLPGIYKKVYAGVYECRRDCFLLNSGVRVGPVLSWCRVAPGPGPLLLLFTFLCEEIPGMCGEWSSFIRVRGSFSKDVPVAGAGGVMMHSHDWHPCNPVPGIRRGFPALVVSMGSPWHLQGMWHSCIQLCRSDRKRRHRKARRAGLPGAGYVRSQS
jgi:hypothetical protein